jgi:hypothetical protein
MAGHSRRPVVQKLGIKPGFCIFVDGAPSAYGGIVGQLPDDVTVAARLKAPLDMVHAFATEAAGSPPSCVATVPLSQPTA